MLSRHLFRSEGPTEHGPMVPSYVSARDAPWLRALLEEHARFAGKKQKALAERLREPLEPRAPKAKLDLARQVLEAGGDRRSVMPVPAKQLRLRLFLAASRSNAPRDAVLERVAAELGTSTDEVERGLFADLRGERRVAPVPSDLTPERLALEANRTLVAALLRRAASVCIRARGNTRRLIAHLQRLGLICRFELEPEGDDDEVALHVSGPFALFRHTEVYGRALASVLPRALACDQFELEVTCAFAKNAELSTVLVRSGDPIGVRDEPAEHQKTVEERFVRDFARIAKDWYVMPNAPRAPRGEGAVRPSFELVHRELSARWLVEVAGFWTRELVVASLSRLRDSAGERFILCIDEQRQCGRDHVEDARILQYRRRVDARAVLARIEERGVGG